MKKIVDRLKFKNSIVLVLMVTTFISCDFDFELPEEGSLDDVTPPEANFSFSQGEGEEWRVYSFANLSTSATDYEWDFGDGNSSTGLDAVNTYPGEGTYTVTLTVSDKLGAISTASQTVEVVEPEVPAAITPVIGAADFEDGTDAACADSRDCWRISGGKIHKTTSDGERDAAGNKTRGAKYPTGSSDNRVTYQAFTVSPNSKYILTARYALQSDGDSIRASVIDGQLDNFSEFADATLLGQESGEVNDGKGNFNSIVIEFETGANGDISILFDHDGNASESYLDNISVVPVVE